MEFLLLLTLYSLIGSVLIFVVTAQIKKSVKIEHLMGPLFVSGIIGKFYFSMFPLPGFDSGNGDVQGILLCGICILLGIILSYFFKFSGTIITISLFVVALTIIFFKDYKEHKRSKEEYINNEIAEVKKYYAKFDYDIDSLKNKISRKINYLISSNKNDINIKKYLVFDRKNGKLILNIDDNNDNSTTPFKKENLKYVVIKEIKEVFIGMYGNDITKAIRLDITLSIIDLDDFTIISKKYYEGLDPDISIRYKDNEKPPVKEVGVNLLNIDSAIFEINLNNSLLINE